VVALAGRMRAHGGGLDRRPGRGMIRSVRPICDGNVKAVRYPGSSFRAVW
jgi:hypothetical protein